MLVDKTLGKYRIVEHLGSGGMAEVYKAYQPGLDRYVAIKVLHSFLAQEEDFLTRFQREAKFAAMLRHPSIIQVYDFDYDEKDNVYYMVMELIEGLSLKVQMQQMAEEGKMIALEDAISITVAIANALDYAHQHGTVHRDVKPANIMFTKENQPILTDFGIAKMVDVAGLTASGAMVGTPAYMAPEQGMGQAGDERSDIYSLGVVFYQLATGNLPFDADTPLGVALKHINAPLPPPTVIQPNLPPSIEAVIMRALAKDPEKRYQTAKEFAAALKQAAAGEQIEPPPPESTMGLGIVAEAPRMQGQSSPQWEMATLPSAPAFRVAAATESRPKRPWIVIAVSVLGVILVASILLFATGAGKRLLGTIFSPLETPPVGDGTSTPTPDAMATQFAIADAVQATRDAEATLQATLNATLTPTPSPTSSPTPDLTATYAAGCIFDLEIVSEPAIYPAVLMPGQQFTKRWEIQNTGTCPWPDGSELVLVSGDELNVQQVSVIHPLAPGESEEISVTMQAPEEYETYTDVWQVQDSLGNPVGDSLEAVYTVGATPTPRPASTPTSTPTPEFSPTPTTPLTMYAVNLVWCDGPPRSKGRVEWWRGGGVSQEYRYFYSGVTPETELPGPFNEFVGFPHAQKYFTASGTLTFPVPSECGDGDYGHCGSPEQGFEIVWGSAYFTTGNCP